MQRDLLVACQKRLVAPKKSLMAGASVPSSGARVSSSSPVPTMNCTAAAYAVSSTGAVQAAEELVIDGHVAATALEDLPTEPLYNILLFLDKQDVAHVKMCSRRLLGNILRACQHWAPKVESWLASDPSSAGLLQQLRGAGMRQLQPPAESCTQFTPAASLDLACRAEDSSSPQTSLLKQQQPAKLPIDEGESMQGSIGVARQPSVEEDAAEECSDSLITLSKVPTDNSERLDWRQVWSCLERAQAGPWQLDARRLTPAAFPHGVLLTFELLLQQPAPPAEPGAREQQTGGWRDCVTVLTFTLDGKTVEIMVDASGKVTSPQRDWGHGSIKLQPGQHKLLALEVSYLFPVAAWFLHPCTLAAPKLIAASSNSSLASSGSSSCASSLSCNAQDSNWDTYSLTASSSSGGGSGGVSIAHSAALCSAVSSLSSAGSMQASAATTSGRSSSSIGRPRLCLDLSLGFGSYVTDPRYMDDSARNQKPRGIERLELAGRVCWRPSKVQSWLGRLLPGIRAHGCSNHTGNSSTGNHANSISVSCAGGGSSSHGSGCVVGSPGGLRKDSSRPSFAVTASKAAVWQVPEDPEYRFMEGFAFWVVQHKAEQLLEHYGILPPWQGCRTAERC